MATIKKTITAPWRNILGKSINAVWSTALISQVVVAPWSAVQTISQLIVAPWAKTINVKKTITSTWATLNFNPVVKSIIAPWLSLGVQTPTTIVSNVVVQKLTGELLEIDNASISGDENSWGWSVSARFKDLVTWGAVQNSSGQGEEITVTVRGQVFKFLIDAVEKSREHGKTTFNLKGRSKTVLLSSPYAQPITKEWPATTAQAVALELCTAAGLLLSWQTVDWPLANRLLSVKDKYPIKIIQDLAKSIGAVVQSSKDGETLIVRAKFPLSPTQYQNNTPAFVVSELDDIVVSSEKYEHKQGYDSIEISDQVTAAKTRYNFSSEDDGVTLKVWVVPFQMPLLLDSAIGNISSLYQGVLTDSVTEDIEIVNGKGRLPKPWYGTLSFSWLYDDLGSLTITEEGEIITFINGQSILRIDYTTKFHQYQLTPQPGVDKAQVYINES